MSREETAVEFAVRNWGGEGIEAKLGSLQFPWEPDGPGRIQRGWVFGSHDGFRYVVWQDGESWRLEAHDGSFAMFGRDGDEWVVHYSNHVGRQPVRSQP
jgi:hypothetical protein